MTKSGYLSEQVYELLKQDIISGAIAPGEAIAQRLVAKRYGVGITPAREAMRRLAHEGFMQARGKLGYVVHPIAAEDVIEIWEMRSVLECAAFEFACERGSETEFLAVARAAEFDQGSGDADSYLEFVRRNIDFHLSIAAVSKNKRLVASLARLLKESARILFVSIRAEEIGSSLWKDEHLAMVEALRARDHERGTQVIRQSLARDTEKLVTELGLFPRMD